MDNGQMASWVARLEHTERSQAQNRDQQFWRDIHPDDLDLEGTHTSLSSHVQPAGLVLFLKKRLVSLRVKLGTNRKSELARTKAG